MTIQNIYSYQDTLSFHFATNYIIRRYLHTFFFRVHQKTLQNIRYSYSSVLPSTVIVMHILLVHAWHFFKDMRKYSNVRYSKQIFFYQTLHIGILLRAIILT